MHVHVVHIGACMCVLTCYAPTHVHASPRTHARAHARTHAHAHAYTNACVFFDRPTGTDTWVHIHIHMYSKPHSHPATQIYTTLHPPSLALLRSCTQTSPDVLMTTTECESSHTQEDIIQGIGEHTKTHELTTYTGTHLCTPRDTAALDLLCQNARYPETETWLWTSHEVYFLGVYSNKQTNKTKKQNNKSMIKMWLKSKCDAIDTVPMDLIWHKMNMTRIRPGLHFNFWKNFTCAFDRLFRDRKGPSPSIRCVIIGNPSTEFSQTNYFLSIFLP